MSMSQDVKPYFAKEDLALKALTVLHSLPKILLNVSEKVTDPQ